MARSPSAARFRTGCTCASRTWGLRRETSSGSTSIARRAFSIDGASGSRAEPKATIDGGAGSDSAGSFSPPSASARTEIRPSSRGSSSPIRFPTRCSLRSRPSLLAEKYPSRFVRATSIEAPAEVDMTREAFSGIMALLFVACGGAPPAEPVAPAPGSDEALVARAKPLELETEYVPPRGDALEHHTAGFAKTLCSAVFITGLDPDFAAENVGYFTGPYEERKHVTAKRIDRENKEVHLTLASGVVRTAKYLGDQGCVALPVGMESVHYTPVALKSNLPDAATTPWPMGDVLPEEALPAELDAEKVTAAVNAAFEPASGMTAAFVVTWKGRIIGEKYGDGLNMNTSLESWSMGKSLTATLMGIMIQQGVYQLDQPAPVPEWQEEGDPRAQIRISDILRMSSGLRCRAPGAPGLDPTLGYLDHLYLYTGGSNSFNWAATRPQEWPPAAVGRYRNCDPVLINYLVRLGVEGRGEEYLSFPRRALFDEIGIRNMVVEADPYGNFLLQGYELGSGRDWARLGNMYLH